MGVETENYEIGAKRFENTDFVVCILVVRVSREILPVGYLKGRYKSESSLMTCEAELYGSVTRMPSSILSDIGTPDSRPGELTTTLLGGYAKSPLSRALSRAPSCESDQVFQYSKSSLLRKSE